MAIKVSFPSAYAKYVQTLVEYDGPQVVLLESNKGGMYICVPIDDEISGYDIPFLASGISKKDFTLYLNEYFDLRYLMEKKSTLRTYVFDIAKTKNDYFHLKYIQSVQETREKYIPESGFFSRNHTQKYINQQESISATHTYFIDGKWTTTDFSRFYARLSDLYSLFAIADVADDNALAEEKLEAALTSYSFQGGGSYRNSFKDLGEAANDTYPLRVSRIQYASPGRIDVRGDAGPLRLVDNIIKDFGDGGEHLREVSKNLYSTLQREGALGKKRLNFSNDVMEAHAHKMSMEIFRASGLPNLDHIQAICADRPVVFAKLALAIYRRAITIARFHEEGRVSLQPR
ncbi:hypothetical protein JHC09_03025 [Devosia sp. MC532]|uniref:hypothetical protein n=1 Tax=Devosia sp. MC532 TaxID=2799788 RepID=UPI0018F47F58|nr:hypothetical protein [Devosia sp. MC532]MBJ7576854.1 hypothetical protein [Devosia sp. MC532]